MTVLYSDAVQLPAEVEAETGARRVELDDLLAEADFISIHTNSRPRRATCSAPRSSAG